MPCGGFGERVVNTMAESKNYIVQPQEGGSATQTLDLTAILGKKNLSSGIRVTLQDNVIDIACNLVVRMGQPVMTVAKNVQEGIANAVESMAGVRPAHVNVNVCGVAAPKAEQA